MKIYDASGFDSSLTGSFSGSFTGDGSNLNGVLHNSGEIASEISGSFNELSGSIATRFDGLTSDYTELTNIPSGILSSSAQINSLSGVSSSYATTSSHAINAITASFALNASGGSGFPFTGSAVITGSLLVSGSTISGSFTGDGSQLKGISFDANDTTFDVTFVNRTDFTASHDFNTKAINVTTYLDDDTLFFPEEIKTLDNSTVLFKFNAPTSGRIVMGRAGHLVSGSFVAETQTAIETFTTASSVVVTHGFDTKNVLVQVYDGDDIIFPSSITTTDNNNVTVGFATPRSGRVVVAKGGHKVVGTQLLGDGTIVDEFVSQSTVVTQHDFNTKNVISQVYLDDDTLIVPTSVTASTNNTITTVLSASLSGRVVVTKGGHIITGSTRVVETSTVTEDFTNQSEVIVAHNFNTKNILVSVYEGDELIIPSSVSTNTLNTVRVRFDSNYTGRVVVAKGGHLVSGSTVGQISFTNMSNIPNGIVSSSLQITNLNVSASFATTSSNALTASFAVTASALNDVSQNIRYITTATTASLYTTHLLRGSVTMSLPSGVEGDWFKVSNRITSSYAHLNPAGSEKIMGATGTFEIDTDNAGLEFIYTDSTDGWILIGN